MQGSDDFLKRQFKHCAQGEIGFFSQKQIISALPEPDERPIKTRKRVTVDGWKREDEDEERKETANRRQIERMQMVSRNTLLMCTSAFPQFPQFDITKNDRRLVRLVLGQGHRRAHSSQVA